MVFFVVEGSAGSRNNLPALGKEMYPLAFLAPVGNALLLPPACWRGRASPNSPGDGEVLVVSKPCLAARQHLWALLSEQLLVGHQQPRAWEPQAQKLAGKRLLPQ